MDQTYQNNTEPVAVMITLTKPAVVADPELKITSKLLTEEDMEGEPYSYIDFGTVEYGKDSPSITLEFEGKNLPAKYTYWDYDSDPMGVEKEADNYVSFQLSTYPFFELTASENGKIDIQEWFGQEMISCTFPIAADGSVKGSVTLTVKKEFAADPFDEMGFGLTAGESVAIGNVAFMDQTYQNNTEPVAVMITLTEPKPESTDPEIKITSELKTETDEDGNTLSYVDFGTVEYGQTSTVTVSFEAKNLPAKAMSRDYETGEETEIDNYVSCMLMGGYADYMFDITLSEGGEVTQGFMGSAYKFPIAADGTAKGTLTITLKSDFGFDPFVDLELEEGVLTALDMLMVMDQTFQNRSEMVYLAVTMTKPATGLENATVDSNKAYKVIENGVVYIIKNGVKYTLLGTKVK